MAAVVVRKVCCIGAGYVGGPTCSVIASKCPDIQVGGGIRSSHTYTHKQKYTLKAYIPCIIPGVQL